MILLCVRGSVEIGKVATGSATKGHSLGNRELGSRVIGEDRSRLPGRGTAGEVRRSSEKRRKHTDLGETRMSPAMHQS